MTGGVRSKQVSVNGRAKIRTCLSLRKLTGCAN